MDKIEIDMKNKIVTVGEITIDMVNEKIILNGLPSITPSMTVEEGEVIAPAIEIEEKRTKDALTAKQRTTFNRKRKELVGEKIEIDGKEAEVISHIKGSQYQIRVSEVVPSNSGGLGTLRKVVKHASHNRARNEWSLWVDRKAKRRPSFPERIKGKKIQADRAKAKKCSKCGLLGYNSRTCESYYTADGELIQEHRAPYYGWLE